MCNYEGYEFGGGYIDSCCIDGYLWDLDSCDEPGGGLTHGGEWACPQCNTERYLLDRAEDAGDGSCGKSMMTPWCGATIWEAAVGMAKKHNPVVAAKVLASVPPFVATDWPDRQAVYDGRASWENTIDRQWPWEIPSHTKDTSEVVATGDWHMEAVYEQIEELQRAAKQADSEPKEALFSDAADMALWLVAETDAAQRSHAAARQNFLTMQGAAAKLLEDANDYKATMLANYERALTAERLLAEARDEAGEMRRRLSALAADGLPDHLRNLIGNTNHAVLLLRLNDAKATLSIGGGNG